LFAGFTFGGVQEELEKINKRLDNIEKSLSKIEKGNTPNKDNKKKTSDPDKVYDISESNSVVLGNPNAKITIIKWTDFQ
jgi:protein-disulfide isomerase